MGNPRIHRDHDFLVGNRLPPQVETREGTERPPRWRGALALQHLVSHPIRATPSLYVVGWVVVENIPSQARAGAAPHVAAIYSFISLPFHLLEPWICLFILKHLLGT